MKYPFIAAATRWVAVLALSASSLVLADAGSYAQRLMQQWDHANFELSDKAKEQALEKLSADAAHFNAAQSDQVELLIWEGIIRASYAGAKGGLGALSQVKQAKVLFERAIAIDETALSGAALTSLGSLYYQVPGWPIGFGDDKKAEQLLRKGLAAGQRDLDAHYFLADFLVKGKQWREAVEVLDKGLALTENPQRPAFEQARREAMQALLTTARAKLN